MMILKVISMIYELNVHESELDVDNNLTCDDEHGMVESCVHKKSLDECCLFEDDRVFEVAKVYRPPSSLRLLLFEETHRRDLLL